MLIASAYGRLGRDPQEVHTKTGTPMATASIAVSVGAKDQEATLWLKLVAFNRLAGELLRHVKGDMLACSGRMELQHWQGKDGETREGWQCIADSLHSSRTVRPGRRSQPSGRGEGRGQAQNGSEGGYQGADPNDDISF